MKMKKIILVMMIFFLSFPIIQPYAEASPSTITREEELIVERLLLDLNMGYIDEQGNVFKAEDILTKTEMDDAVREAEQVIRSEARAIIDEMDDEKRQVLKKAASWSVSLGKLFMPFAIVDFVVQTYDLGSAVVRLFTHLSTYNETFSSIGGIDYSSFYDFGTYNASSDAGTTILLDVIIPPMNIGSLDLYGETWIETPFFYCTPVSRDKFYLTFYVTADYIPVEIPYFPAEGLHITVKYEMGRYDGYYMTYWVDGVKSQRTYVEPMWGYEIFGPSKQIFFQTNNLASESDVKMTVQVSTSSATISTQEMQDVIGTDRYIDSEPTERVFFVPVSVGMPDGLPEDWMNIEPDEELPPEEEPEIPEIPEEGELDFQPLIDAVTGLTEKFPFCIPFDFLRAFQSIATGVEPPDLDASINICGFIYDIPVDVSVFEPFVARARVLMLFLFDLGLVLTVKKLMGGGE